ncbi:g_PROTEIN_RECEP_F1_2 domain-containing protein [Trichonephila inaurata madagascariensis]|uniref:G_PROTEIN_RECEP_F1_2 domain-containing protein n=1 Tax=Trichonephila inaurata madagascariensis TaxID=2747483 RepID=A0A8X7CA54_9ARAC|nr:g_PROTEIN_RECEP_F1_2 domain-containing protein [Trichonephila inaurata madagascariensis]
MAVLPGILVYMEILWIILIVTNNFFIIVVVISHKSLRCTINNLLLCLFTGNLCYGISTASSLALFIVPNLMKDCCYCCLWNITFKLFTALVIFYSLIAITVDRYIAVFYPLRYPEIVKPRLVKITVISIWTISFLTGGLPLLWNKSGSQINRNPVCAFLSMITNSYIWTFIIPPAIFTDVIILYVYLRICLLKCRQRRQVGVMASDICGYYPRSNTKTNAVLGIIIFSSVFALTPFLIAVILITSGVKISNIDLLSSVTYELTFINPMFTPVIFGWRNENFNKVLKTLIDKKVSF